MMRKTVLVLVSIFIGVFLAAGVVLAKAIDCPNRAGNLCVGTAGNDTMVGTSRADDMRSLGRNDVVRARAGNDTLSAGEGMDELGGSRGNDTMHAGRGADELTGGFGNDTLSGAGASDTYFFGDYWGDDRIDVEGNGEDILDFTPACCSYLRVNLDPSPQRAEAHAYGGTLNFPATVEIENVRGGKFDDTISGNAGRNKLYGGQGDDDLFGLSGNDDLIGGAGWDGLYGGDNADILTDTSPDKKTATCCVGRRKRHPRCQ